MFTNSIEDFVKDFGWDDVTIHHGEVIDVAIMEDYNRNQSTYYIAERLKCNGDTKVYVKFHRNNEYVNDDPEWRKMRIIPKHGVISITKGGKKYVYRQH